VRHKKRGRKEVHHPRKPELIFITQAWKSHPTQAWEGLKTALTMRQCSAAARRSDSMHQSHPTKVMLSLKLGVTIGLITHPLPSVGILVHMPDSGILKQKGKNFSTEVELESLKSRQKKCISFMILFIFS
jgi:hypothetical protein